MKKKVHGIYGGLVILLLAGNVFLATRLFQAVGVVRGVQAAASEQYRQAQIVSFTQLFVENVLMADETVDFEVRLQLENAVRAIGDEEIVAAWKRFTESGKESDAQVAIRELMQLLRQKMAL